MARPIVIAVILEDCKDGWLRVRSDDLPGLILSGPDREEVVGCIAPAICTIFEHYGHSVKVRESQSASSLLNGPNPRTVDMHVEHRFVVEVAEAA